MKNVIIIGSGLGGLFAGNLLSRKGHKVTIFESHSAPGGYTAGFKRKGYYFESGTISFEASASVFMAMKDLGILDKIDFVKLRTRFFSGEFDGMPENYGEYKEMVKSGYPADKDKLKAAFSSLDEIIGAMGNLDTPLPFMYSGLKVIKSIMPFIFRAPKLIRLARQYGDMTSSEFAARYFEKGSKLYDLIMGYSYPDIAVMSIGGALMSLFEDFWTVKGGMQSWADVLAENFKRLGGELKLNSCVDRIITENGAAVGVLCKGTLHRADCVISAGDYKKTLLQLLDDKSLVPQALKDSMNRAAVSEGYFTVYLGLKMPNEELQRIMKAPHIIVCGNEHRPYDSNDEDFFAGAKTTVYSPTLVNPNHAPEGKSSLMLMAMAPYRWMDNWGSGDREVYRHLKDKVADVMIDSASRVIPGLKELIELRDAATPLTYERFTHNSDGATSAWSFNPRKKFHRSMLNVNIDTPVKNLYIGSCWAMQMGGVPGALAAAYRCAERIK